ncbi:MAG: hypothetical protein Q9216_006381 [Gyalolechia sp. 2 TL-2023]
MASVFSEPNFDPDVSLPDAEKVTPVTNEQTDWMVILRVHFKLKFSDISDVLKGTFHGNWTDEYLMAIFRRMLRDLRSNNPTHPQNPYQVYHVDFDRDRERQEDRRTVIKHIGERAKEYLMENEPSDEDSDSEWPFDEELQERLIEIEKNPDGKIPSTGPPTAHSVEFHHRDEMDEALKLHAEELTKALKREIQRGAKGEEQGPA